MVFSSPNFATVFDTHFSDPYGRPLLIAYRIFSISSWPWDWFSHFRPCAYRHREFARVGGLWTGQNVASMDSKSSISELKVPGQFPLNRWVSAQIPPAGLGIDSQVKGWYI